MHFRQSMLVLAGVLATTTLIFTAPFSGADWEASGEGSMTVTVVYPEAPTVPEPSVQEVVFPPSTEMETAPSPAITSTPIPTPTPKESSSVITPAEEAASPEPVVGPPQPEPVESSEPEEQNPSPSPTPTEDGAIGALKEGAP